LAIALGRNWKEGERHLARGLILPWLRDELRDQDAANLLIDLTEDRVLANEDRLLRLIVGLGKGLPPVWRSISLDRETLESHCRNALSENTEDADIVADVFNHGVLRVWGDAGHEDCAAWQRSWIADAQIFPELWKKLVDNGGPDKKLPSPNNYLPALLLMILSQEFRKSLREEITQHSVAIARCFWFKNARLGQSNASLLVSQSFLESAREQGETEIESAENVRIALYKLQTDFASVLVSHSHLRSAVAKIEGQLANNRAWEARTSSLPALSRDLFEQAKTTLVSESVSYQWRRGWSDCAIDGIIFGAIMVGVRSLSGYVMAGDALGFVGDCNRRNWVLGRRTTCFAIHEPKAVWTT
jgi:hypothetical protein